jgi:excisionase family DNA binding protein
MMQGCLKSQHPIRESIPNEAGPVYVSKREAARLIGISVSSIDNARRDGRLKAYKIGAKAVRFDRNEVLALANLGRRIAR